MARRKKMTDLINNNRSVEIVLGDESTIEMNLAIYLSTDSTGSIANERLNSTQLSKTLALIEYMLITALQCSMEEMEEMLKAYGN
jgi:hypothetical protein